MANMASAAAAAAPELVTVPAIGNWWEELTVYK